LWVRLAENLESGCARSPPALEDADVATVVPINDRLDVLAEVGLASVLPGDARQSAEL
jgi:hypothetical protein